VTRRLPDAVEKRAREEFDATLNPTDTALTTAQLCDAIRGADGLLPTVTDRVTAEVLRASPRRAKIVANFGVGFNNIDVDAAKQGGIVVTNTPDVLTDETADLAIGLLLMVARRLGEGERELRAGRWTGWRPTHMMATKVSGKTLGIIGLGRIGRAVAKRASGGFAMRVIYHDPPVSPADGRAVGADSRDSVEAVLREADFVSLHAPASPDNAFLINTARGDLVDEAALVSALESKTIAGAGLDVYEKEPTVSRELVAMENVVLLPHLGSASTETRVAMGMRALDNLATFFSGAAPRDRVA